MEFPRLLLVRQNLPEGSLSDIPAEVRKQLSMAGLASGVEPGARVAIGVGSRGIADIATIVRAVADFWKSRGCLPFIFPAMGSHGAATAEGQAEVLARFGIHEAAMGCPVVSTLDAVPLGRTPEGIEVFMDRAAFESNAVMLVNRVKWHTDFTGRIESGLMKMMAIGLGKFAGARQYHTFAYKMGLEHVIRTVGRHVLRTGKILGGLAILEDANHRTAQLTAVPAEEMERKEEELLAQAKSWRARIPVRALDLLIVDELGKEISGAGMDTKVINRGVDSWFHAEPDSPRIERLFVRDLSEMSYSNAVGIGLADVVTDRLVRRIDWTPTLVNALAASKPEAIRIPMHFPTDRECLEKIWPTAGKLDSREITIGWIRNTLELGVLALSENLLPEIQGSPSLEILGPPFPIRFDGEGNLARFGVSAEEPATRSG